MKKLLFTAALFVGLISSGFSQDMTQKQKKTPEERAQQATTMLEKKLNLTSEQKTKLYAINLDRAKKMNEMQSAGKGKPADRKTMMEDSEKQIEAVLNAEQLKTYAEMKAQGKEKAHAKEKKGQGDSPKTGKKNKDTED